MKTRNFPFKRLRRQIQARNRLQHVDGVQDMINTLRRTGQTDLSLMATPVVTLQRVSTDQRYGHKNWVVYIRDIKAKYGAP